MKEEYEEEETEEERALNGISQVLEFLSELVTGVELNTYKTALAGLESNIQNSLVKPSLLTNIVSFFDHLANEDRDNAKASLSLVKKESTPKDLKWIKSFETVLANY